MDAYEILVIILSITLAICLILTIILLSFMLVIVSSLKRIMAKAEVVAGNVEEASEFFKNTTMTGAAVKFVSNIVSFFNKPKKKGHDDE